ncbi:MAG: response regulator [Planctomycetes bacterium]|nr:response regulator [Planctomycetota bacterium]
MRALVVDDDVVSRGFASAILKRIGFEVEVAATGHDALQRAIIGEPAALVLVDWHLGAPDAGLAVIRQLRALPGTHHTCVCLWSVDRNREIWNIAIHAGANAVLPKPLGPEHMWMLLSRLGVLQAAQNAAAAPALR